MKLGKSSIRRITIADEKEVDVVKPDLTEVAAELRSFPQQEAGHQNGWMRAMLRRMQGNAEEAPNYISFAFYR